MRIGADDTVSMSPEISTRQRVYVEEVAIEDRVRVSARVMMLPLGAARLAHRVPCSSTYGGAGLGAGLGLSAGAM